MPLFCHNLKLCISHQLLFDTGSLVGARMFFFAKVSVFAVIIIICLITLITCLKFLVFSMGGEVAIVLLDR